MGRSLSRFAGIGRSPIEIPSKGRVRVRVGLWAAERDGLRCGAGVWGGRQPSRPLGGAAPALRFSERVADGAYPLQGGWRERVGARGARLAILAAVRWFAV